MARQRKRKGAGVNRRRGREAGAAGGFLGGVGRRSREQLNRKAHVRRGRDMWAWIAMEQGMREEEGLAGELLRIALAMILLPVCWVTTWTFLQRFSHATVEQGFWLSTQFWYFAIGALVMLGWFWSRIWQAGFLYCYVLGHELTHAAFVKCFGGKVLEIKWGSEGGHVTTDKTNWVIALSPYFVPFWSVIAVIAHVAGGFIFEMTATGNLIFYAALGATWSFHLTWTLWMIPRDQPDLKDNGTFLSLVLIYFGNLLVLITLLCLSAPAPLESFREFGYSWMGTAVTWGDTAWRWMEGVMEEVLEGLRVSALFSPGTGRIFAV